VYVELLVNKKYGFKQTKTCTTDNV